MCYNKLTISLTKNPMFYGRSKYIDIKFHYICEFVKDVEIKLEFYQSKDQVTYIFTKPLSIDTFTRLKKMMRMITLKELDLRETMMKLNQICYVY